MKAGQHIAEGLADPVGRLQEGAGDEFHRGDPVYDIGLAAERVAAAAEAAHAGPARLVLTARAENYLHGRPDLADTISRLQAYQAAGADVLYAPGLTSLADITQVVRAVDRPVNVLAMPGVPPVGDLAAAGVTGSRSGAPSRSPPSARWPTRRPSFGARAPTATSQAARPEGEPSSALC
jgi:hypothetical protein